MWSIENIWEYTLSATIYGSITGIMILIIKDVHIVENYLKLNIKNIN